MLNYKFRLYPTEQQVKVLNDTLETCRHLYNDSLGERSCDWDVNFWIQKQLLTLRKVDSKYYKQVHSQVLQDVLLRLDKAYQAFFSRRARYPKFKRREKYNSIAYPQYGGFQFKHGKLVLSCIGAVEIRMHRIPVGTLKRCTIIRDVDQWYCSISSDDGMEQQEPTLIANAVGVDVGLLNWIVLSDGYKIDNPLDFKAQAQKINQLQRSLSRKKKGSHNREKARIQLAKTWRKVRRQRDDFVHKTSKVLADNYDTTIFEKLNINNMVKNHNLAAAIMDATWGKAAPLHCLQGRKARWTGHTHQSKGNVAEMLKVWGGCGNKTRPLCTFECRSCGLVVDRDLNAAINILKLGLEQARAEKQPLLVRQRISKFALRKQEARGFIRE